MTDPANLAIVPAVGHLSDAQLRVVAEHVRGRQVADYGAGYLEHSLQLLELGAKQVIAVDERQLPQLPNHPGLTFIKARFEEYMAVCPVAFVSWPVNCPTGLHRLLKCTPVVIYLGSNLDGNACGYPMMWYGLSVREVLAHAPEPQNTLIVYGAKSAERTRLPEEQAALDQSRVYTFGVAG